MADASAILLVPGNIGGTTLIPSGKKTMHSGIVFHNAKLKREESSGIKKLKIINSGGWQCKITSSLPLDCLFLIECPVR